MDDGPEEEPEPIAPPSELPVDPYFPPLITPETPTTISSDIETDIPQGIEDVNQLDPEEDPGPAAETSVDPATAAPTAPAEGQARLNERVAQAETLRMADQHNKEPSAGTLATSDKQSKPERKDKYKPIIKVYRRKPAVSEEQLTELIWGSHEQRTIDLFFAWEQARQSSELSHILERITNIEGVTAFIIFDIYEPEKYPPESYDGEDVIEENVNGFPVKGEQQLRMIDGKWEIPPHIIYTSTDLATAKKIIPFTKQLIWRLVETTRDLDPKNDVRYLRLISDINEIVVMPMFPRHFLIAVQEPKSSPNVFFENIGIVTTHPVTHDEKDDAKRRPHK